MRRYTPTDGMRTNPLSWEEGGSIVKVVSKGFEVEYDNIKFPKKYIESAVKKDVNNEIVSIYVNGNLAWTETHGFEVKN
jgi:hypothetical protein